MTLDIFGKAEADDPAKGKFYFPLVRASSSLLGTITLFEAGSAVPMFLVFAVPEYLSGGLDASRFLTIATTCAVFGLVMGVFFWFVLIRKISAWRAKMVGQLRDARLRSKQLP